MGIEQFHNNFIRLYGVLYNRLGTSKKVEYKCYSDGAEDELARYFTAASKHANGARTRPAPI